MLLYFTTSVDVAKISFKVALQNMRAYKLLSIDKLQLRFRRIYFLNIKINNKQTKKRSDSLFDLNDTMNRATSKASLLVHQLYNRVVDKRIWAFLTHRVDFSET